MSTAQLPILLLNGPNLNVLGLREPDVYGSHTLADVEELAQRTAHSRGWNVVVFQTNSESAMIDRIHEAHQSAAGIVINPGAWTHTSVAVRDAVVFAGKPMVEVHISNIFSRENFRHHSYFSDLAQGIIVGCGISGYGYAVSRVIDVLEQM